MISKYCRYKDRIVFLFIFVMVWKLELPKSLHSFVCLLLLTWQHILQQKVFFCCHLSELKVYQPNIPSMLHEGDLLSLLSIRLLWPWIKQDTRQLNCRILAGLACLDRNSSFDSQKSPLKYCYNHHKLLLFSLLSPVVKVQHNGWCIGSHFKPLRKCKRGL